MSCLPESKLAREAEIAYQMICMSTDYDCWHSAAEDVTVEIVMENMRANAVNARRFLSAVLDTLSIDAHADLVNARHLKGRMKFGISTPVAQWKPEIKEKLNWLYPGYFEWSASEWLTILYKWPSGLVPSLSRKYVHRKHSRRIPLASIIKNFNSSTLLCRNEVHELGNSVYHYVWCTSYYCRPVMRSKLYDR